MHGTHILEDNQGTVDAADGVVADSRRHAVRGGFSWVSHLCCGRGVKLLLSSTTGVEVTWGERGERGGWRAVLRVELGS